MPKLNDTLSILSCRNSVVCFKAVLTYLDVLLHLCSSHAATVYILVITIFPNIQSLVNQCLLYKSEMSIDMISNSEAKGNLKSAAVNEFQILFKCCCDN